MKVLVADRFETVGVDGLKDLGCEVVLRPDVKADELAAAIREVNPKVLIVRSTKVNAAALGASPALALVVRAGAGIDTIDVPAASRLGVFVANCPGKNSIAVAELIMGLLLSCDRRIPDQTADLKAGIEAQLLSGANLDILHLPKSETGGLKLDLIRAG